MKFGVIKYEPAVEAYASPTEMSHIQPRGSSLSQVGYSEDNWSATCNSSEMVYIKVMGNMRS